MLYPLGIPLFLVGAMRYMHIRKIVKEKMDAAKVASMLALFMRRACSVECQRVARLVGNVDSTPEEFDRQSKSEFSKLLALQGDTGSTTLVVDRLRSMQDREGTQGMEGITMNELVSQKSQELPPCRPGPCIFAGKAAGAVESTYLIANQLDMLC